MRGALSPNASAACAAASRHFSITRRAIGRTVSVGLWCTISRVRVSVAMPPLWPPARPEVGKMGTMSTTPLILPFQGMRPRIHESAYLAPGATIIGDVAIGADSSVFYGCDLRGVVGPIRIGARTNIDDNSVLSVCFVCGVFVPIRFGERIILQYVSVALASRAAPGVRGSVVTGGHKALVHACEGGDGVLVGMSATILSGARVGSGSLIAAG